MKKKYFIPYILFVLFSYNLCFAQQTKTYFPILRNTYWATNAVTCDTLILITGRDAMIDNCTFALDTIYGSYRFTADDTVVAEFTSSTGANHFPKNAPPEAIPHFVPFKTTYLLNLKDNTLTVLYAEQKNSSGEWVKVTSSDDNIRNYSWYKVK